MAATDSELKQENRELRRTIKRLNKRNAADQRKIAHLRQEVAELRAALYAARTGK